MTDARVNGHPKYNQMIERLRQTVRYVLPAEARVLVISKGDEELLQLDRCRTSHFPQSPGGGYAGHYPADDAAAIAHLESLRACGAEFLVIPETSFWWLDHYREFAQYLETRCRVVHRQESTGVIFALHECDLSDLYSREQLNSLLENLLPSGSLILVAGQESVQVAGMHVEYFSTTSQSRPEGAGYLVVPKSSFAWLEAHADDLNHRYRCITRQRYLCVIYALGSPP